MTPDPAAGRPPALRLRTIRSLLPSVQHVVQVNRTSLRAMRSALPPGDHDARWARTGGVWNQQVSSRGRAGLTSGAREGGELPPRKGQPVAVDERVDCRALTTDDHLGPSGVGRTGQPGNRDEQDPKALYHVTSSWGRAVGVTSCGMSGPPYRWLLQAIPTFPTH